MNKHNSTKMNSFFDRKKISVGKGSYGELNVIEFEKNDKKLVIGSFCSIAPNVTFFLDGEHNYKMLSTFPFGKYLFSNNESISKKDGNIIVGDDVWIGYGAKIFSGVKIGQGAVIAAGAYVVSDVEPYSIVGGVPAKFIKKRFSNSICDKLERIDFNNIKIDNFFKNYNKIFVEINEENVDEILGLLYE